MSEEKFACAACGLEYDRETAVNECRRCHRSFCDECLDENGICVSCEESA
jgi:hypothetical protein